MKLGILGATGWLGQALGLRLIGQGIWPEGDLVLANRSGQRDAYAAHPGVAWGSVAEVCSADVIVIAVRPQDFPLDGFDPGGRLVIATPLMSDYFYESGKGHGLPTIRSRRSSRRARSAGSPR